METNNCWEFLNCPEDIRNKCEVFKLDSGKECWFLGDGKCACSNTACFDCDWYKKNNSK